MPSVHNRHGTWPLVSSASSSSDVLGALSPPLTPRLAPPRPFRPPRPPSGLRVLVYSGDHDMVVPHTGTTAWLYGRASGGGRGRLGRPDGPLRPWALGGQVAGWTASWPGPEGRAGAGVRGLRYASVKGAGHMVPQSKPAAALALLRAHLEGTEL